MNEIESLEREFVEEETDTTAHNDTDDQDQESVESSASEASESEDEEGPESSQAEETDSEDDEDASSLVDEVSEEYESNVVSLGEHRETPQEHSDTAGQMQFSGAGKMDFNLNFLLGNSNAEVKVSQGKLQVSLEGVEMTLSEDGCEVSMEGGVKFSVPLQAKASKKRAA
jgi:hypothetical protein